MKSTRQVAVNELRPGVYRVSSRYGRSPATGRFLTRRRDRRPRSPG